jgi:hypothetical protein
MKPKVRKEYQRYGVVKEEDLKKLFRDAEALAQADWSKWKYNFDCCSLTEILSLAAQVIAAQANSGAELMKLIRFNRSTLEGCAWDLYRYRLEQENEADKFGMMPPPPPTGEHDDE